MHQALYESTEVVQAKENGGSGQGFAVCTKRLLANGCPPSSSCRWVPGTDSHIFSEKPFLN